MSLRALRDSGGSGAATVGDVTAGGDVTRDPSLPDTKEVPW